MLWAKAAWPDGKAWPESSRCKFKSLCGGLLAVCIQLVSSPAPAASPFSGLGSGASLPSCVVGVQ